MSGRIETVIGQRINSSSKSVAAALRARDAAFLQAMARAQIDAGANALDLNVSAACARAEEPELLSWLVGVVQEVTDLPLCLDSGDANSLAAAALACHISPIVNSLSLDQIDAGVFAHFVTARPETRFVILCARRKTTMSLEARLACAEDAAKALRAGGVSEERLIFDPLMYPASLEGAAFETTLETMSRLRGRWPRSGILCACGNFSHGANDRKALETACIENSRAAGADVFLCDPALFS